MANNTTLGTADELCEENGNGSGTGFEGGANRLVDDRGQGAFDFVGLAAPASSGCITSGCITAEEEEVAFLGVCSVERYADLVAGQRCADAASDRCSGGKS